MLAVSMTIATDTMADDIVLQVNTGPAAGQVDLLWSGTGPYFDVYRGLDPATLMNPGDLLGSTTTMEWVDTPPGAAIVYYAVTPPFCGNGVRDPGEQCDDGNVVDLDGCSSSCAFEQVQRAIYFKMQFLADATCPQDALGEAFVNGMVQSSLQASLDSGVANGSFSLILASIGAHDLTGTNDSSFQIGFLTGLPQTSGASVTYNGTNDLDWWYVLNASTISATRQPVSLVSASIASKVLTAGPGTAAIPALFGAPGISPLTSAQLSISIGSSSAPLLSTNGGPPGHLVSENLDPSLVSYATCGAATSTGAGHLCGGIPARSLAAAPLSSSFVQNCTSYTTTNTMLDLLIGGCTAFGFIELVKPTQPDTVDPTAPPAGAGGPYTLLANAQKVVTTCKDKNGQVVDLGTCLAAATYSSYFQVATDRVIPK